MKLFAFKPNCHGPMSYFVMAENEEQAVDYVSAHVASKAAASKGKIWLDEDDLQPRDVSDWINGVHVVSEFEAGQVTTNCNE